jgi:hypothetical protein
MRSTSSARVAVRHGVGSVAEALLVVASVITLAIAAAVVTHRAPSGASDALAAPRTSGTWIRLSSVGGASLAAASPALGTSVTFDVAYPKTVKNPRIEVLCSQAGELVYGEAGAVSDAFLLGGGWSLWKERGGSADCVANLYYFGSKAGQQTYNWLAGTSFAAGG